MEHHWPPGSEEKDQENRVDGGRGTGGSEKSGSAGEFNLNPESESFQEAWGSIPGTGTLIPVWFGVPH